jgi:hypothetical protein
MVWTWTPLTSVTFTFHLLKITVMLSYIILYSLILMTGYKIKPVVEFSAINSAHLRHVRLAEKDQEEFSV